MNNLSISLAQQEAPITPNASAKENRQTLVANARRWADKAIVTAAAVSEANRNEECDRAVAVATYNLGEISEMEERFDEARSRYLEAKTLAQQLAFKEGIVNAETALKRLAKSVKDRKQTRADEPSASL